MKKIVLLCATMCAILCSCSKVEKETSPFLTTFSYRMTSGSMTKAIAQEEVVDAIRATLPESIDLVLKNSSGKNTIAKTGEGVILAEDTYQVQGSWASEPVSSILSGTASYLSHAPEVQINESVAVTKEQTNYTLNATYRSFALVCDTDVASAYLTTAKGTEEVSFLTSGTMKIVFAQGEYETNPVQITIVPTDTEKYKETTFTFFTKEKTGCFKADYGVYYVLHPTADGQQPKVLEIAFPDFAYGGDLEVL